jgi:hypothetical protein
MGRQVDTFLVDPRYSPREVTHDFKAGEHTLVHQLGTIYAQLVTGRHPFDILPELDDHNIESAVLRYAIPCALTEPDLDGVNSQVVGEMLSREEKKRPGLKEVVSAFSTKVQVSFSRREERKKERNTLLWIGRMGIPHRGHIEYICRFLEMGFFVRIAISRAYTLTEKDPLPKWLVAKMVAQSLFRRGYGEGDFDIMLTPYYLTKQEMKMHFLMLPQNEDVVGVASSNPGAVALFQDKPIFDQQSVFGVEGLDYEDLSWGSVLRGAVKEGDVSTFQAYVAEGVEDILSFPEIQRNYAFPEIEFVKGRVMVTLEDGNGEIVRGRVLRYSTPEQSLVFHLNRGKHKAFLSERYSKKAKVVIDGRRGRLRFDRVSMQGEDEIIVFKIEEEN